MTDKQARMTLKDSTRGAKTDINKPPEKDSANATFWMFANKLCQPYIAGEPEIFGLDWFFFWARRKWFWTTGTSVVLVLLSMTHCQWVSYWGAVVFSLRSAMH
jgi:hypothetical protein